jgi:hypothetical protein
MTVPDQPRSIVGSAGALGRVARGLTLGAVLSACGACDRPQHAGLLTSGDGPRPGATAVEPGSPELAATAGQTIYTPAYSAVATGDNLRLYQLAITLSVRNTDRTEPIVVTTIKYHHQDGRLVRDFLKSPVRLAPLATLDFHIREGDTTGGTASSFVVEWVGEATASAPMVETVMVGTAGNQGISFTCPGRVVADRGRSNAMDRPAPPNP